MTKTLQDAYRRIDREGKAKQNLAITFYYRELIALNEKYRVYDGVVCSDIVTYKRQYEQNENDNTKDIY